MATVNMLEAVAAYQETLRLEKRALLTSSDAARTAMATGLKEMMAAGKQRIIKREPLMGVIPYLETGNPALAGTVDAILPLPIRLDIWTAARVAAESGPQNDALRAWAALAETAVEQRNAILEPYLVVLPRLWAKYFRHDTEFDKGDMEAAGLTGMIRGLEVFDPKRGANLEAHMVSWATAGMTRLRRRKTLGKGQGRDAGGEEKGDNDARAEKSGAKGWARRLSAPKANEPERTPIMVRADDPELFDRDIALHARDSLSAAPANAESGLALRRILELIENMPRLERKVLRAHLGGLEPSQAQARALPADQALFHMRRLAAARLLGVLTKGTA